MPSGGNPISLSYARQLVKNYKDNDLATSSILPNDTQAVWFSKEILLEALGVPAGSGSADITGLRFYFGAYGYDVDGYPADPDDQDKLTLVIVETGTESIEVERKGEMETVYLDLITDTTTEPSYPDPARAVTDKTTFNDGQSYPPPANRGLGL